MKHKTFCGFAKSVDEVHNQNKKLYVIMWRFNDGKYSFEAMHHCRKTKLGIFSIANNSYYSKCGREMKILEVDLAQAKVLFEGIKEKENTK